MMIELTLNKEFAKKYIVEFIREESKKIGLKKTVIGLSGGIDSTLSFYLSVEALGSENVIGIIMPYGELGKKSKSDAIKITEILKTEREVVDIKAMCDPYFEKEEMDRVRKGNYMARTRMAVLFDKSKKYSAFVTGTSNKSEILVGYTTWYGDMAASILPLGDLYKTQVRILAKYLGVPDFILNKVPSAELWEGQSDEGEMGITYDELDKILYLLVDLRKKPSEIVKEGFDEVKVNKVLKMVFNSHFKRKFPPIPKISSRTVGIDFLYFRDYRPPYL